MSKHVDKVEVWLPNIILTFSACEGDVTFDALPVDNSNPAWPEKQPARRIKCPFDVRVLELLHVALGDFLYLLRQGNPGLHHIMVGHKRPGRTDYVPSDFFEKSESLFNPAVDEYLTALADPATPAARLEELWALVPARVKQNH